MSHAFLVEQLETRTLLSTVPISDPPVLNSLPGATASIYLDFNGNKASNNIPFSRDHDFTTFSNAEQADIKTIWSIVAEKYSPFNINVTTVPPKGPETHVVITNGYDGPGEGGVAYIGTFPNAAAEAWVNGTMSGYAIGVTTAHEVGHTMGLVHQSLWSSSGKLIDEYRPGNGSTTPIMGNATGSGRAVWAYGTSSNGPHSYQDDMAIIAGNHHGFTFGYRPDKLNSVKNAEPLEISGKIATETGVIAKTIDQDYYSFSTNAGTVSFTGSVAANAPMLHMKLELLDSTGKVLKAADTSSLGQTLSMNVAAGEYYVIVASHGVYGDVGQYTLKGTIVPV